MALRLLIRGFNNYDTDDASLESGLECLDESLADASQQEDADINTLVRRFGLAGEMPQDVKLPLLEDYDEVFDFQTAMERVRVARDEFMRIPAEIRFRFSNDPQKFMEFCLDERNVPELRKLGLSVPEDIVPVPPAPVPA